MLVPDMLSMAAVMADKSHTEEEIFDLGISEEIIFLVVVPLIGACRVPVEALSHFMAGADDYTAEGMPEHWHGTLSGKWKIKRDRLRILESSWINFSGKFEKTVDDFEAIFQRQATTLYAEQLANRRAANCYDIHEAAQAIALQLGLNENNTDNLRDDMGQAAFNGALVVRSPRGHDQYAPTSPPKTTYGFDSLTTPDDVNKWATDRGFRWRWLLEPPAPPVGADEIDFNMLATRKNLIDAFGKFTDMDITWFDNLNTSPKLKAARKYAGQGGRHSAEPLFCPHEVMQWLADPKRKKGKPLSNTTAWRLLKSYFPKVYNQYSIGDPNTD